MIVAADFVIPGNWIMIPGGWHLISDENADPTFIFTPTMAMRFWQFIAWVFRL